MNRLIDKSVIIILATICSMILSVPTISIISSLLIAIIIMSVSQCVEKKAIFYIIHTAFVILCFLFPSFFLYYPITVYEIMYTENKYVKGVFSMLPLVSFVNNSGMNYLAVISIGLVALFLSLRTSENERLNKKLIQLRDMSEENNILLMERNKYLTQSRYNEINLAVMGERNRIAREIHDNVGHMLSRTILQMGALKVINKDENIKPHIEEINNSLNGAMTSMRESVHNLHDDSVSLMRTVKEIIKPLSESVAVKFETDISENAPNEIKLTVIGIVKEAVSNIIRHSSCDRVSVILREHPAFYQIAVEDNGKNIGNINEGGMGIENMRLRVEKSHGIFKTTANESGFKIFASIPKERKNL